MKKIPGIILVSLSIALLMSACAAPVERTLTDAERTAIAGTVTAVFADKATEEVQPSATPTPEPTQTSTPVSTKTAAAPVGPDSYPEGVNPLTGLKVEDPELLNRRPVIMKISNHQIDYQPQWGLSKADIIFEYFIGWGANRFAALYYGQDSDKIGPVRSIRRVDGQLGSLYQAVVGSTGGDGNDVLPYLNNYIPGRYFVDKYLCPGVCDDGRNVVYSVYGNSAALSQYFNNQGYALDEPDLSGMAFYGIAPEGGEAGESAWISFSSAEGSEFVYDEDSEKYLRFAMDETTNNVYGPSIDQNTGEQLAFSNVIVVNVPYTEYKTTLHSIELIGNSDGLPATAFRDGKAYEITWKAPDAGKPIQFFDGEGKAFMLKPGNSWIVLHGMSSSVNVEGGSGASRLASHKSVRTLIVSDIHANLTAFEAVLSDAGSYDQVWCLGDVVGYGPDPNECITLLRQQPGLRCIMGNHDAALMGYIDLRTFNDQAARAVTIQSELLSQESRDFLELLDIVIEEGEVTLAHGSPRDPIWEYVVSSRIANENFPEFQTQICLVGHSHIPSIFVENPHGRPTILTPQNADRWRSDQRFILNPGSVGQPRDRNPKAAYVIWDDQEDTWLFKRVAYDVEAVQKRILALGIPSRHASRLSQGI